MSCVLCLVALGREMWTTPTEARQRWSPLFLEDYDIAWIDFDDKHDVYVELERKEISEWDER